MTKSDVGSRGILIRLRSDVRSGTPIDIPQATASPSASPSTARISCSYRTNDTWAMVASPLAWAAIIELWTKSPRSSQLWWASDESIGEDKPDGCIEECVVAGSLVMTCRRVVGIDAGRRVVASEEVALTRSHL